MPISIAGRAPATFEIKSANLPLVCLLLKSTDLAALARELDERYAGHPDFFDDDPLLIDLTPLPQDAGALDFTALTALLKRHRVRPVAVRGGDTDRMRAAVSAGLAAANDAALTPPRRRESPPESAPAAQAAPPAPAPAPTSALVVDRPLRAGQQVYARGRDLVVLCMVNPGAEVIADGNIHVYAPLRGKAIAGARGNADARIFTLCLEPQLISIAGVYRTLEEPLPPELHGRPAQVRLEGATQQGRLLMEALSA